MSEMKTISNQTITPIHQSPRFRGTLRKNDRKILVTPLKSFPSYKEDISDFILGKKSPNQSLLAYSPPKGESSRHHSELLRKPHTAEWKQRKYLYTPERNGGLKEKRSSSGFEFERLNRFFINGILNRKNKSFRIKQRNDILGNKNPELESIPFFREIISGRIMNSQTLDVQQKILYSTKFK